MITICPECCGNDLLERDDTIECLDCETVFTIDSEDDDFEELEVDD